MLINQTEWPTELNAHFPCGRSWGSNLDFKPQPCQPDDLNVCFEGRDVAQAVGHSAVKVWILLHGGLILHGGHICSLGYFPFQPVVHNCLLSECNSNTTTKSQFLADMIFDDMT